MKQILIILALLYSACSDDEMIASIKNCMNEIYKNPSIEVYDKCYYYENEFQRQLINLNQDLAKLYKNYNGIKDIQIKLIEKSSDKALVKITTVFNNSIKTVEKRQVFKQNNQWKISAEIIN